MGHGAPCKHVFCPQTQPQPPDGIKRSFFFECGHVAYQIKGKEV